MKKLILASALLGLSGCYEQDSYDLEEVSGKTYLINKQTGSVALVKDTKLIELQKLSMSTEKKLNIDSSIEQKLKVDVIAKQIEDRLFYKMDLSNYVTPFTYDESPKKPQSTTVEWLTEALKKNSYDRIILQFQDKDGFVLSEHPISLDEDYTNIWGPSGKVVGLQYTGSIGANPLLFSKVEKMEFLYAIRSLDNAPTGNN